MERRFVDKLMTLAIDLKGEATLTVSREDWKAIQYEVHEAMEYIGNYTANSVLTIAGKLKVQCAKNT